MTETLAGMNQSGPIGRSIRRLEDGRLLRGQGAFVDDLNPEGCIHVAILRSPVASGRITGVDMSAAKAIAAFTAADLEGTCTPLVAHIKRPGAVSPPRPILAVDRVRFVGEMVAAVVAADRYAAADAIETIGLDFEPMEPVVTIEQGLADGAPIVDDAVPGNLFFLGKRNSGDVPGAFGRADAVVECTVDHPRLAAAPIECRGVVAAPNGDGVTLWTSTQVPHLVSTAVAECLGLEPSLVRVVAADAGGGFGVKAQVYPEEVLLAWMARRLRKPVKWIETRSEHMQSASHARDQRIKLSAAVRRDGRVLGLRATVWSSIGAYGIRPFGPLLDPLGTAGMIPGPYDIRDYEYETFAVATNKSPEGPYRGVGIVTAALAHERLMDAVAARLELDPADVRRVNFIRPEQMPYASVTGHPYESGDYAAGLEAALAAFDYAGARDARKQARAEGRCVGVGIGSYVEYTGAGSSTFTGRGMMDIPGVDVARAWRAADGRIHVQTSCPATGQGSHTTLAQVAAAGFGVEPEEIVVEQTYTAMVGVGTGSFMSRGSVTAATAVFRAAALLRELEAENGDPDVTVTYDAPQASHPYATHLCMVEVDRETGDAHILKYAVAEDCGVLINPMVVEGQVVGGVAQGIGAALLEEVAYGPDGQLQSGTLIDYLVPTVGEIPAIAIQHLHTPSTVHELGTKGAGEGGTIGATAAVANAIADALGLVDVTLPLTPERLHGA